ncbi:MAG: tetratricopeptide repeat protein [Clostridium sp.]|nr:tetratricopeptide repeat protein [Clostridium sp.]
MKQPLTRILSAAILLLGSMLPLAAQSPEYLAMVDSAETCIAADDLDRAELFLDRAMRLEPSSPGNVLLLSNLGIVRFRNGKTDEALRALDDANRMAPRAVVVLDNRAQVLVALGRDDEALRDYTAILSIDSLHRGALFNHGMLSLSRGNLPSATNDFDRLLRVAPDDRNTWLAQASVCNATGRYAEAAGWFTRLIDDTPEPLYYLNRAFCRLMTEEFTEAAEDISHGLELDPDNPAFYDLRATLNRLTLRNAEAEADEKTALRLRQSGI